MITKHHLTPKDRGGSLKDRGNILMLKYDDHHHTWHILFHVQTLEEIIIKLLDLACQTHREYPLEENLFAARSPKKEERKRKAWKKLFGDHTFKEVIDLLIRIKRYKCRMGDLRLIHRLYARAFFTGRQEEVPYRYRWQEHPPRRRTTEQYLLENCP